MKYYTIIDKETSIHEYTVQSNVNDDKEEFYQLYYANNGHWSDGTAGTLALTMIDSGDDIKFKPPLPKVFEYGDLERVRVLMMFQERLKSLQSNYIIFEEKLIGEI